MKNLKKCFKIILFFLISICIFTISKNIILRHYERKVLKTIYQEFSKDHKVSDLHTFINDLHTYVISNYINKPKCALQFILWKKNRGFFRQTPLDTLLGKAALCGENSRLMVNLLIANGIKARRLYLFEKNISNHVIYEYFDTKINDWIALNSLGKKDPLTKVLASSIITRKDYKKVFSKLGFHHYSTLNFSRFNLLNKYPYDIPYLISYLIDDVYLLKICLLSIILIFMFIPLFFL